MNTEGVINKYNISKEMYPNKENIGQLIFHNPLDFVYIHNHVNKYICYCEIVITKDGLISYAIPSHSEASLVLTGKTKKEFFLEMKESGNIWFFDCMGYLNSISGALSLWYDSLYTPSDNQKITDNQILSMLILIDNGCLEKSLLKKLKLLLKSPCMSDISKDSRNFIRKAFNDSFIKKPK